MVLGLFNSPTPYKGQNYAELKKQAIESGHPFIDNEFPPDDKALFYSGSGKVANVEWKRPKDICDDPKLFVDGASSNDLIQGALGNCWFVAASSCLATHKAVWQQVIPNHKEQEWDSEDKDKYAGIFHFHFWRYGEWIDVVIDDFLPTRNGELVYVHSKSRNEFWSALLEKAYAKLFGCYEALDGGELAEALEDFTGGVSEPVDLVGGMYSGDEAKRDDLFKVMKKESENKSLMAAAIPAASSEEMEASTDVGLVKGHAYGITAVKRVAIAGSGLFNLFNREKLSMIRLRNPWGGCEWNGAFSDGSPEWDRIDKADREKIGLTFDDDGEFWMQFEDFCKYFHSAAICRVVNTSLFSIQKTWHESLIHGEWKAPHLSGGCINNKDTVLHNPQYKFEVGDNEDEVLLSLTQKTGRGKEGDAKVAIGFTILKVEENRHYRCHRMQEVVTSSAFKNSRSIFLRHTLQKGRYVLIACSFEPGHNGLHMLRIYSSSANHGRELSEDKPSSSVLGTMCSCFGCCRYPSMVTQIKVIRAMGLESQDKVGGADPYVIIKNERDEVYSPVRNDTTMPEWNTLAIFYRRQPVQKPIKVQIWNKNPIRDEFMGQYQFPATTEEVDKVYQVELVGRKDKKSEKRPGKLFVQITTSRNLQFL